MDQVSESLISSGTDEFWKGHILSAQAFSGSNREYCRLNGLNHRILSFHKRRLGFGRPRKSEKLFVELKTKSTNVENSMPTIDVKRKLPDARWVAEFISAMMMNFGK